MLLFKISYELENNYEWWDKIFAWGDWDNLKIMPTVFKIVLFKIT